MDKCLFCDPNVLGKQKIYETENEYVLYNIRKTNKGRCIVVPKRHVENIRELNEKEACSLITTVQYVSDILVQNLGLVGVNYGFNEGVLAGQMVSHFHFHLLPRFKKDPLPEYHLFHSEVKKNLNNEELNNLVSEFRKMFKKI